jgi:hypothetical protein
MHVLVLVLGLGALHQNSKMDQSLVVVTAVIMTAAAVVAYVATADGREIRGPVVVTTPSSSSGGGAGSWAGDDDVDMGSNFVQNQNHGWSRYT